MAAAHIRRDAIPAEMLAQQAQVSAAAVEFMKDTPMYQLYQRVAPRPEDFGRLLDKIGESMAKDFDFSEEVRGLKVPTLIVAADADMAPPSHYVEVFKLLDGGLRDGGWMGEGPTEGRPRARDPAGPDPLQPGHVTALRGRHALIPRRAGSLTAFRVQSRPSTVAMSASLPAESARVHQEGAYSSRTNRPPAASAAATRASACS